MTHQKLVTRFFLHLYITIAVLALVVWLVKTVLIA